MSTGGTLSSNLLRFGDDFELDPRAYELRRSGQVLKLERIPMELLLLLVEQRGQLVSREYIVEKIWGKDVFLDTDNSINAAIRKIRQVLGDDPDQPRFVQTVTGRGYRFIAPVFEVVPPVTEPEAILTSAANAENLLGKKISHYRILQFLGGGGMGVVYRAEDLKLGRQVALKFLPSELASDQQAFERFEREARAASSLDHPNICSIYQLGEYGGQPFIIMQLLEGETLREWIEKSADLDKTDRLHRLLDIAVQILDGLEAAHEKGIIHRDIKPANIFITHRGQAKILDFGVAKFMDAAELDAGIGVASLNDGDNGTADPQSTRTGVSLGTPSYLSPEQIRRDKLDPRTDLFSFGLVLYEMATGQRAFSGSTATVIRDAVIHSSVVPVQQLTPGIPAELCAIIGKCLEKDRTRRYQSAAEIRNELQSLRAGMVSSSLLTPAVPSEGRRDGVVPSREKKHWRILALAAGVIVIAVVGYRTLGPRNGHTGNPAVAEAHIRRSVAVLGFDNLSGRADADWLSTGLSEMLSTELAAGGKLRLIPGADVSQARKSLHISDAGALSKYNLGRIRKTLGADLVVFGSYTVLGDGQTRLDLRLQDTGSGENVASLAESGDEKQLFELISVTGSDMRQRLGVGNVSSAEVAGIKAALPSDTEAARLYSRGLERLRVFECLEARDLLLKASELDPKHAATHTALADAWRGLGYDGKAQEEAQKALDLSANLSREDRLWIEGQLHEVRHEWEQAATAYRALLQTFPDGLEYGLHLAGVQVNSGKSRDALETIALLRKLPPPAGDDPRIDAIAANTYGQTGDFKQEQVVAIRAVESARAHEANLVAARALGSQCEALYHLGEFQQSIAICEEAQRVFTENGDRNHAAGMINSIGLTLEDQGNFAGAKAKILEALAIARKIGDKRGEARYTNNLALALSAQSDAPAALKMFAESLKIAREIGDKRGIANTLGNIGLNLEVVGDFPPARPKFEEAISVAREIGNKNAEASNQIHVAELSMILGDLPGAKRALTAADTLLATTGDKRHHLYALFSWIDLLTASNDLPGARSKTQEALDLAKQIGAKDLVAYSQMTMANVSREDGHANDAIALAQAALDEFQAEKAPGFELQAYDALGYALLVNGNPADADKAMQRASEILSKVKDPLMRIDVTIGAARTTTATGRSARALPQLRWAISEAHHLGALGQEFEARLALGEIEMKSGSRSSGRVRLQQLHKDAQAKGYLLVVRKAAAAQTDSSAAVRHP